MRILINGLVVFRSSGHLTYFSNLIPELGRLGGEHEFLLLQAPWQKVLNFELPPNFIRLQAGLSHRSLSRRVIWEQIELPRLLRREHVDVMFSPVPSTTMFAPCPTVIAVRNPEPFSTLDVNQVRNFLLRVVTKYVTKRAKYTIFVSEYSRQAALTVLNIDPMKTKVIYHGTSPHFFQSIQKPLSEIYKGIRPYILTVSTVKIPKNYPRLLEAFAKMCSDPEFDYDFVFAGAIEVQKEFERIEELIAQLDLKERIHYMGEVPNRDLPALYRGARLYVLPSLLETFGHTMVEAMASGIPLVVSNSTCMPEIAGDAALLFNPYDVDDIKNKIMLVLNDGKIRERLVMSGKERVKYFTWERSAQQMLELFVAASDRHTE